MLNLRRLNHITVNCKHGEDAKARWFYGDVLGLEEIPNPGALNAKYHLIWYKMFNIVIHLDFSEPFTPTLESRHFAVDVTDIKAAREHFVKNGVEVREAVIIPDRDRFYIVDPFGNYIEVLEMHADQGKADAERSTTT